MYCLYIIQDGKYYKIGITDNWKKRLSTIQTGNPNDLLTRALYEYDTSIPVQAIKDLENRLHLQLKKYHRRGEWFELPSDILSRLLSANPTDLLNNKIDLYKRDRVLL